MGVIRTILIFFAIYYISKIFIKYIAPVFLVKYMEKKAGNQMQTEKKPKEKEGTVTIDKKPQKTKQMDEGVGEYVDYEEVD